MRAFRTSLRPATRTRLRTGLFAGAAALAALSLTACQDGTGVQDEGASQPAVTASEKPAGGSGSTDTGMTQAKDSDKNTASDTNANTSTNVESKPNVKPDTDSDAAEGATEEDPYAPENRDICNSSNTQVTVQEVSRPLNHMLVTVTNKGDKLCDLPYYPWVRFGQMQWAPQIAEYTKPQAVVTLAPGESGYAGVMLASADGSGENPEKADKVSIGFQDLNGEGSGPATTVNLPGDGVYFDSTLRVTYWQQSIEDALYS
ncbi:hypothetical protein GCM10010145_34870 [Streptomyces ruber]|uniref:DUF4232 domain-containing protein n=2 Tax=Streptomyces TaxID=1883 RepID=A0A918ERS1_9ACTN|nr:DUF4232 domain-containing protein [Streptomyces ruber]GGQ62023.1 hypothetical protein GCM10010145_34870 [Streptomyces ruber]